MLGADALHPELANATKKKPIHILVHVDDIRCEWKVEEGGYLTENNHIWIPSNGKVQKKVENGNWIPRRTVDASVAGCIPYETLEHGEESYYQFFQQVKLFQTVYYLAGQDGSWEPCPTSDRLSF